MKKTRRKGIYKRDCQRNLGRKWTEKPGRAKKITRTKKSKKGKLKEKKREKLKKN